MIFNAMSTDYYPRLAAIADDIVKIRETVLHQAYVAVLLITPIIILFIIFSEIVIILLYSREFLPVVDFLLWAILGTIFKAVSFSMGYIFIAKGDSRLFVKNAVVFNALLLTLNILGYYFGGLVGLGFSFFVYYILHLLLVGIITKVSYNFYFPKSFYGLFLLCLMLCGLAFGLSYIESSLMKYGGFAITLLISGGISTYLLNKKMDLLEVVQSYIRNKKNTN
jgi:O-antigen/teichoic acid export membrane protein